MKLETDSAGWIIPYRCVNCGYRGYETIKENQDNEYFCQVDSWKECPSCKEYINVCKDCGMVLENVPFLHKCRMEVKQLTLDVFGVIKDESD